jgi:[ribosomal protein S18]-alanine N-acetyltransferase
MRRRHLRGVLRIEHRVYPKPWSLGLFISELGQRSTRVYLVARVQRSVVGYLGMFHTAGEAHVTTIAVDPDWHRRGIGSRLLAAAARAGQARGCRSLSLEVRVSNQTAQALYRRFGFAPAGVRPGYYPDNREDALIMWATDIDSAAYSERLERIERSIPGDTIIESGWL